MLLSIDTVITGSSMSSITRRYCWLKHMVLDWIAGSYSGAAKGKRGLVSCHTSFLSCFFFSFVVVFFPLGCTPTN